MQLRGDDVPGILLAQNEDWSSSALKEKKKQKNIHILSEPHLILMNHIKYLLAAVLAFKGQGAHNNKVLSCRYFVLDAAHMDT